MTPRNAASPVPLSYVAALRGFAPRRPGEPFAYAVVGCTDPAHLAGLAASNPEGKFYGLIEDAALYAQAEALARKQRVDNVFFLHGGIVAVLGGRFSLPPLNYLCADESAKALDPVARAALFDIAKDALVPGGIFHYAYRAYDDETGPLRFLVREFAPEMAVDQANVFLHEIRTLGGTYFAAHPAAAKKLDDAIARRVPDMFFADYDESEAHSGSFDTIVALRPRGFAYAGDSTIAENYIDFSVPPEAQKIIFSCRNNHLYEPIKDFTLNRAMRSDIWCREPAPRTANMAELFGSFTYGIMAPRAEIPAAVRTKGPTVDLSSPLFAKLIDLMSLMPVGVGDFLAHPDGQGFVPDEIVAAIQTLVACGIAQPMRGLYRAGNVTSVAQPRFSGNFNRASGQAELAGDDVLLASPVMGSAISVSASEALVMQALDRAGLANSVSALLPELERIAKNPALARNIAAGSAPTAASAQTMIEDTVTRSIVQWYAYGLLEAA